MNDLQKSIFANRSSEIDIQKSIFANRSSEIDIRKLRSRRGCLGMSIACNLVPIHRQSGNEAYGPGTPFQMEYVTEVSEAALLTDR